MLAGEQPACWECERTAIGPAEADALQLHRLLELGMGWELALSAMSWAGTRDDLAALATRIETIKSELSKAGKEPR